jgi:hypothetical protein
MNQSKLLKEFETARDDLDIELIAPFELNLGNNTKIRAEFLVKNFGARNGMLIVKDYETVAPYLKPIADLGYGFSVLEEPSGNSVYDREVFVELLSDWGWSGDKGAKPSWLKDFSTPEN